MFGVFIPACKTNSCLKKTASFAQSVPTELYVHSFALSKIYSSSNLSAETPQNSYVAHFVKVFSAQLIELVIAGFSKGAMNPDMGDRCLLTTRPENRCLGDDPFLLKYGLFPGAFAVGFGIVKS